MREIKFRFFTPDNRMIEDHDGWVEGIGINEALNCSKEYGYKIMQFTGLCDKNGKEIYEGDILEGETEDAMEPTGKCIVRNEVVFRNGGFGWLGETTSNFYTFDLEEIHKDNTVVGDIHRNPELLK